MSPEEAFDLLVQSYEGKRGVTSGKMFASYGLKVDGKIFAMLYKGTLVVKLPATRANQLTSVGKGEFFQMGKRVMKEWLVVQAPPGAGWKKFAEEAREFVGGSKRLRSTS